MNKIVAFCALLIASVTSVSFVEAQSDRASHESQPQLLGILFPQFASDLAQRELVRREIALTDEQAAKIKIVESEFDAAIDAATDELRQASQTMPLTKLSQEAIDDRWHKTTIELNASNLKKFKGILSSRQLARLDEIAIQFLGPELFGPSLIWPEVIKQFGISHDQVSRIGDISRDCDKANTALAEQWEKTQEALVEKALVEKAAPEKCFPLDKEFYSRLAESVNEKWNVDNKALERIVEILTPAQRAQLAKMRGRPVDTKKLLLQHAGGEPTPPKVIADDTPRAPSTPVPNQGIPPPLPGGAGDGNGYAAPVGPIPVNPAPWPDGAGDGNGYPAAPRPAPATSPAH